MQLRRALGLRRGAPADGAYYKETSTEPLQQALDTGRFKQYRVTFPDGSKMFIHASPGRVFHDLAPDPRLAKAAPLIEKIGPGWRVLDLGAGTGVAAAALSDRVGESGGVVAIEDDAESVEFAQRRYPAPSVAYERSSALSLAGETDGAFDAVLALRPWPSMGHDQDRLPGEVWRLVAPGGYVLIDLDVGDKPTDDAARSAVDARLTGAGDALVLSSALSGDLLSVLVRKRPEDEEPRNGA